MKSTYALDPDQTGGALLEASVLAGSDVERALLERVHQHLRAEMAGDLPAIMATLCDEPVYNIWSPQGPMRLSGRATIEGLYEEMFAAGAHRFEFAITKVVATAANVVTEGRLKQVHTAQALAEQNITNTAFGAIEPGTLWLSDAQLIIVWPCAGDGMLVGEDMYYGEDAFDTLVPIEAQQLPPGFTLPTHGETDHGSNHTQSPTG